MINVFLLDDGNVMFHAELSWVHEDMLKELGVFDTIVKPHRILCKDDYHTPEMDLKNTYKVTANDIISLLDGCCQSRRSPFTGGYRHVYSFVKRYLRYCRRFPNAQVEVME